MVNGVCNDKEYVRRLEETVAEGVHETRIPQGDFAVILLEEVKEKTPSCTIVPVLPTSQEGTDETSAVQSTLQRYVWWKK